MLETWSPHVSLNNNLYRAIKTFEKSFHRNRFQNALALVGVLQCQWTIGHPWKLEHPNSVSNHPVAFHCYPITPETIELSDKFSNKFISVFQYVITMSAIKLGPTRSVSSRLSDILRCLCSFLFHCSIITLSLFSSHFSLSDQTMAIRRMVSIGLYPITTLGKLSDTQEEMFLEFFCDTQIAQRNAQKIVCYAVWASGKV